MYSIENNKAQIYVLSAVFNKQMSFSYSIFIILDKACVHITVLKAHGTREKQIRTKKTLHVPPFHIPTIYKA